MNFGGTWYSPLELSSNYLLGSAQVTISVSSGSAIPRACHNLMTISGLIKHVSQRGKDVLVLLCEEGWGDTGRDSVLTRQSKK